MPAQFPGVVPEFAWNVVGLLASWLQKKTGAPKRGAVCTPYAAGADYRPSRVQPDASVVSSRAGDSSAALFSLSSALPSHRPVALLHMRVRGRQMAWLIHPGACFRRDGLVPRTRQPLMARGGGPLGPPLRMLPAWVRASPPP